MQYRIPKEIAFAHFKILSILEQHHAADPQMGVSEVALFEDLGDDVTDSELVACLRYLRKAGHLAAHEVDTLEGSSLYYAASTLTHAIVEAVSRNRTKVVGGKSRGPSEAYRACEECGQLQLVTRKNVGGRSLYLCRECLCRDVVMHEHTWGVGPGALLLEC